MSPRFSIRLLAAQSDQRLVALARDGHERAFEALVQRYRRPLLRYCRSLRLSDTRAEDVLQQALLRAWLALSGGTEVRDVRPWLYRIVHNTAVNAMRGVAEVPDGELTDAVQASTAQLGESELDRKMAVRDALGHVAALPKMQRQAVFLTAVDGQSHDEVAGALGITPGALRGVLYRARTTLRSAAAMLTPQPLLELAARSGDAAAPSAERALDLTSGGAGAVGIAGLLLKGGAAVITAGALATGATVVASHEHRDRNAAKASASIAADASSADRSSVGALAGAGPVENGTAFKTQLVAEIQHHSEHHSMLRVDRSHQHGHARHDHDDRSGALSSQSTASEDGPSAARAASDEQASRGRGDHAGSQHGTSLRADTRSEHRDGRQARTGQSGGSDGASQQRDDEQAATTPAPEGSSDDRSGQGDGGGQSGSSILDPNAVTSEHSGDGSSTSGSGRGSGDSSSGDDANTPSPE